MKKIVTQVITYQCRICKTQYLNKKDALRCEAMPVEKKAFVVGDQVSACEPRRCSYGHFYRVKNATVIGILGPQPYNQEYTAKWLGGQGADMHVFQYEVEFVRPCCKNRHAHVYYAPELRLANTLKSRS